MLNPDSSIYQAPPCLDTRLRSSAERRDARKGQDIHEDDLGALPNERVPDPGCLRDQTIPSPVDAAVSFDDYSEVYVGLEDPNGSPAYSALPPFSQSFIDVSGAARSTTPSNSSFSSTQYHPFRHFRAHKKCQVSTSRNNSSERQSAGRQSISVDQEDQENSSTREDSDTSISLVQIRTTISAEPSSNPNAMVPPTASNWKKLMKRVLGSTRSRGSGQRTASLPIEVCITQNVSTTLHDVGVTESSPASQATTADQESLPNDSGPLLAKDLGPSDESESVHIAPCQYSPPSSRSPPSFSQAPPPPAHRGIQILNVTHFERPIEPNTRSQSRSSTTHILATSLQNVSIAGIDLSALLSRTGGAVTVVVVFDEHAGLLEPN